MRLAIIAPLLLAGCEPGEAPTAPQANALEPAGAGQWSLQFSPEGASLLLGDTGIVPRVRLFCPAGAHRLVVNVPGFTPVGSEERMTFGSGGEAATLVADSRGDPKRGGVSGSGPVPDDLARLIAGPIAVNYGAQDSGPHPAPPPQQARAFAAACSEAPPAEPGPPPGGAPENPPGAGACRTQDGRTLPPNLLRAVGTEPFWGARVEGRCVTYSHPDNQSGTRIWTRFTGTRDTGVWTGFYEGERFVLRTRPEAGCSDGMSDRRYPLAVSLSVGGEERNGCAELL